MGEFNNIAMSGSNLKFYMNQKNITVEELARGTGISERSINRYRTGERLPDIGGAYAIAAYLQMDLKQIWCVFDKN